MLATDVEATILQVVADLTGVPATADQALGAQGLDSLAAMELRQKLQVPCPLPAFSC